MARSLPFEVDLWKVQNVYYQLQQSEYPKRHDEPEWVQPFLSLGDKLRMHAPALVVEKEQLAA